MVTTHVNMVTASVPMVTTCVTMTITAFPLCVWDVASKRLETRLGRGTLKKKGVEFE